MNTNPDETKLALWLDDELTGEELASVEAWVADHPEHLAAREEARRWKAWMAAKVEREVDPPHAEFFNARIARHVASPAQEAVPNPVARFSWSSWLMPLAACAGMVLAFHLGSRTRPDVPEIDVAGAPKAIPVDPVVYTPESGVNAEWINSTGASATVIVLNGVNAIPDSTDFSSTAGLPEDGEIRSMAGEAPEATEKPGS